MLKDCEERKQSKTAKGIVIEDFIKTIEETNSNLASCLNFIWSISIDKCIISEDKMIESYFKNKRKIKV